MIHRFRWILRYALNLFRKLAGGKTNIRKNGNISQLKVQDMPIKILVTTDLSANSRAGIRFAMQIANQTNAQLIFYHHIKLEKPVRWSQKQFLTYADEELKGAATKLGRFIDSIYSQSASRKGKIQLAISSGSSVEREIIDQAVSRKANFICMSTRGAGTFQRMVGTTTSYVLTHSPVPVLVIPKNFKQEAISHILYASDLNGIQNEVKKVKAFSDAIKAKLSVLHYDDAHGDETRQKFRQAAKQHRSSRVKFYLEKYNWEKNLSDNLKITSRKYRPSLLVWFTHQDRSWYERVFFASRSAAVAFDTNKAVLVYPK
jgi:nucleotide-binding universal stress UspA family protein